MSENKKGLVAGFHIVSATDHCINKDTSILDSLTSLSLAKAYYSISTRTFRLLVLLLSSQTHDFVYNY